MKKRTLVVGLAVVLAAAGAVAATRGGLWFSPPSVASEASWTTIGMLVAGVAGATAIFVTIYLGYRFDVGAVYISRIIAWRRKPAYDFITKGFAERKARELIVGSALLTIALVYEMLQAGDLLTAAGCAALIFIFVIRGILTWYRARRGYFGTNASEVAELISFIADEKHRGTLPPGSRVSPIPEKNEEVSLAGVPEGARMAGLVQ